MRSHQASNPCSSPRNFYSKPASPVYFWNLMKADLSFVSWTCQWFSIVCLSQTAILCSSWINWHLPQFTSLLRVTSLTWTILTNSHLPAFLTQRMHLHHQALFGRSPHLGSLYVEHVVSQELCQLQVFIWGDSTLHFLLNNKTKQNKRKMGSSKERWYM